MNLRSARIMSTGDFKGAATWKERSGTFPNRLRLPTMNMLGDCGIASATVKKGGGWRVTFHSSIPDRGGLPHCLQKRRISITPLLRNLPKLMVLFFWATTVIAGCRAVGPYSYASSHQDEKPSHGKLAQSRDYYPGKLRIEKGKKLTKEERVIEARFAKYLEDHTDDAVARYRKLFGNESNTDSARELSKDYAPGGVGATDPKTNAARTTWGRAVHEPATALVKEIYKRELKKPAGPDALNQVVFTAGGVAAGKSTSLKQFPRITNLSKRAQIVVDSTLSSLKAAIRMIEQALEAGKTVSIFYVHRDAMESFVNGALPRAEENGRTLPLDYFLKTHMGAPRVLLHVAKRYRDDLRVAITVIDGNRGVGSAVITDLKFLERVINKYKREELRAALLRALDDAYKKGERGEKGGISEIIYRSFKDGPFEKIHRSPSSEQDENPPHESQKTTVKRESGIPSLLPRVR